MKRSKSHPWSRLEHSIEIICRLSKVLYCVGRKCYVSRLCHARLRYDLPPRAQASAETVDFHMKTVIASCLWSRDTKKYRGVTKPNKRRGLWEISTLDFQVRVLPAKVGREGKAFAIFEFYTVLTT